MPYYRPKPKTNYRRMVLHDLFQRSVLPMHYSDLLWILHSGASAGSGHHVHGESGEGSAKTGSFLVFPNWKELQSCVIG